MQEDVPVVSVAADEPLITQTTPVTLAAPPPEESVAPVGDCGAHPVPVNARRGFTSLGVVFWGVAINLSLFLTAELVTASTTVSGTFLVMIAGTIGNTSLALPLGLLGAHTHLSTGMCTRVCYGTWGALGVQLALCVGTWGWFGVQLGVMVNGLGHGGLVYALRAIFNVTDVPTWPLILSGGFLMTLTAFFGYKALDMLSRAAVPLLILALIVTTVTAPPTETSSVPEKSLSIGELISSVISGFAIGAVTAPDMARMSTSKRTAMYALVFGFGLGQLCLLLLASAMIIRTGEGDFTRVMASQPAVAWAILAVLAVVLSAWSTNDNNLYSGALAINAMVPRIPKSVITVCGGVLGTVAALAGIHSAGGYIIFLNLIGIIVPPAGTVMAVDYLFFRGTRYDEPQCRQFQLRLRLDTCVALLAGCAVGAMTQAQLFSFTRAPAVDASLAGGFLYFGASVAQRRSIHAQF